MVASVAVVFWKPQKTTAVEARTMGDTELYNERSALFNDKNKRVF